MTRHPIFVEENKKPLRPEADDQSHVPAKHIEETARLAGSVEQSKILVRSDASRLGSPSPDLPVMAFAWCLPSNRLNALDLRSFGEYPSRWLALNSPLANHIHSGDTRLYRRSRRLST